MDSSLRREIVEFVRYSYFEEGGIVCTMSNLLGYFRSGAEVPIKLSLDAIYHAFPGGMKQICQEAGVPVIEERYRGAAAASAKRKTARGSRRGIGGDEVDLEKAVFAALRRGLQPIEVVEQVLRLTRIFKETQHLSITQTQKTSTPSKHTT